MPGSLINSPPVTVISIGGMDPGGGAGLVRDLLTGEALGARVVLVGSAWTRQSARGVAAVEPRDPEQIKAAIEDVLLDAPSGKTAVKIGMLATSEGAEAVRAALAGFGGPVVLDPVLAASSGGRSLFAAPPPALLPLARRVTLLTPNCDEAALLLGEANQPRDVVFSQRAAQALCGLGVSAVLVKGGHLDGDESTDVLQWSQGQRMFFAPRVAGRSPRGTGCALATAIAVQLASGADLPAAVESAKAWLLGRIRSAHTWPDGERRL